MSYRSSIKGDRLYLLAAFAVFSVLALNNISVAAEAGVDQTVDDTHTKHQAMLQAKPNYQRTEQVYHLPDVELIDMHGKMQSFKALVNSDRPILLSFIFTTCPSICPVLSATFAQFQKNLDATINRPLLISISIDPEHDNPERMLAYAQKFKAGPDWLFLTGSLRNIIKIEKAFDAYRGEKMNHAPLTFLHEPGKDYWIRLDGFTSGRDLLGEYKQLLGNDQG